jgi:hypothetical protein
VLKILARHFIDDADTEGFKKNGPVAVAKFEMGEDSNRDDRLLRQREVSDLIARFLKEIGA